MYCTFLEEYYNLVLTSHLYHNLPSLKIRHYQWCYELLPPAPTRMRTLTWTVTATWPVLHACMQLVYPPTWRRPTPFFWSCRKQKHVLHVNVNAQSSCRTYELPHGGDFIYNSNSLTPLTASTPYFDAIHYLYLRVNEILQDMVSPLASLINILAKFDATSLNNKVVSQCPPTWPSWLQMMSPPSLTLQINIVNLNDVKIAKKLGRNIDTIKLDVLNSHNTTIIVVLVGSTSFAPFLPTAVAFNSCYCLFFP